MKEPKGKQPWFLGWIANGELMETFAGKPNDSGRSWPSGQNYSIWTGLESRPTESQTRFSRLLRQLRFHLNGRSSVGLCELYLARAFKERHGAVVHGDTVFIRRIPA